MKKICQICAKKSQNFIKLNKLRGKYNPSTKRKRHPNIQWTFVPAETKKKNYKEFAGKRILACTKCIKALSKTK
jgi:ribosomal protein L28